MPWDIEQLFHEVADLGSEERAAHFESRAVPLEVREELESLLRHDAGPETDLSLSPQPEAEAFGPYKLIRKLGAGGMATVYLATRTDGEIEHSVAIKVLRHGSDAPWLIARFLRERQILASLRHPGIAQLLDAGRTASGQPYLVMEYVDGTPIDAYCERLPLRKKIEVVLQVCDAVAYAHRNLVIHRDLKPSNILVDASGRAKLLDFGIAKILDAATDVTRTRERMLTPEYASPEQIRGGVQTTATDVYLMGAVLYKLLTGTSPHVFAPEAESIDFVICKKEPAPPSRLRPDIPKDLDFILGMALRKEPESRYASIEALMDDLRALYTWRPVRARSGGAWYRTRKFLRRYWVPVTAATIALTGLSVGLIVASNERSIAQRRFMLVRQMANRFFQLDRDLAQLNGSTRVRHTLVSTSLEYLAALGAEAKGDPELAVEVASAYLQMAAIQGVPTGPNLGEPQAAEASLKSASALLDPVLRQSPNHRAALLLAGVAAAGRMILANTQRRDEEAQAFAAVAAHRMEAVLAGGAPNLKEAKEITHVLANVSLCYLNTHRFDEGIRVARLLVDICNRTGAARDTGQALSLLANGLRFRGDLDEALVTIRKARAAMATAQFDNNHHRQMAMNGVTWREGMILGNEGGISLRRPSEAIAAFEESMDLVLQAAANDRNDSDARIRVGSAARELAHILRSRDPKRSLAVYEQGLQALAEAKPSTKTKLDSISLLAGSSHALRALQRSPEARQRVDHAMSLAREMGRYPAEKIGLGGETFDMLVALAEQEAASGNQERSAQIYQELVEKGIAAKAQPEVDLANAVTLSNLYRRLSELLTGMGNNAAARSWKARRIELWTHWQGKLPGNRFVADRMREASGE